MSNKITIKSITMTPVEYPEWMTNYTPGPYVTDEQIGQKVDSWAVEVEQKVNGWAADVEQKVNSWSKRNK